MWALFAILSALFLGFYDICKKRSLNDNSVVGVLTCSVLISAAMLTPMLFTDIVPHVDAHGHLMIFIKSLLVLSSWLCGYIALKYLPISIVSPMQASRPMWTLVGALLIFHESLNAWQWAGVIITLGTIFAFAFKKKSEIKNPQYETANRFYIFLVLAILLGSCCGLYDKHIMRTFDRNAVQVYYTLYQALMMSLLWLITTLLRKRTIHTASADRSRQSRDINCQLSIINFHWRWSILGISVFLILSDYVYLRALSDPDSLIAVVSTIRRAGMIIPFLYGIIILREKDVRAKLFCLTGITLGLICLLIGTL